MDSNQDYKLNLSSSVCLSPLRIALILLCVLATDISIFAQDKSLPLERSESSPSRSHTRIAEMNDEEVKRFFLHALDLALPDDVNDDVYLVAKSRSHLIAFELFSRIELARHDPNASAKFIRTMADILAYAANEMALDLIAALTTSDRQRFGPYIGKLLDYSNGRHNPYSLAYHAVGLTNLQIDNYVVDWVERNRSLDSLWAEAIVERNKGVPDEEALLADPIIARLSKGIPTSLRNELLGINELLRMGHKRQIKR